MNIAKLFYCGKCVMTVDMDYINGHSMLDMLNEIMNNFVDRAYTESGLEKKCELECRELWKGNEKLYELKSKIEQELKPKYEDNPWESPLYEIMKDKLSNDEYELFRKLQIEEVSFYNKCCDDFFCGTEVQDYVWIEFNGTKRKSFFGC